MSVEDKLKEWLVTEGYPIEFRTARAFHKQGFRVFQGHYTRCPEEGVREIDVLAHHTHSGKDLRIYHVMECKWSGDKPWVVFTSESGRMAPSACVNQTIGSLVGQSIAWILAGEREVSELDLFSCPPRPGFNGRQAFAKGNDAFFASVQSVVSKAKSIVDEYDRNSDLSSHLPAWGAMAFPVVVVKGGLFEAHLDPTSEEILVKPAKHLRIHWRGSIKWKYHASVDILSDDHVGEFAAARAVEVTTLLNKAASARENIEVCWNSDSLKPLAFQRAPRGTTGLPKVLSSILVRQREKEAKRLRLAGSEGTPNSQDIPEHN